MRLEELEIRRTRGIVDTKLDIGGGNFLISGRNGAGKSAVVDAIDLLLKGTISRLEGEGTGSISLKKHGPHIDATAKDSIVVGVFVEPGTKKRATITRSLKNVDAVKIEGDAENSCNKLMTAMRNRQFILTRRQILQFISSAPKDRLKQVSSLLNLSDVETVRSHLLNIQNERQRDAQAAKNSSNSALSDLNREAGVVSGKYDDKVVLAKVNELRGQLGAEPVANLAGGTTLGIVEPTTVGAPAKTNWTAVVDDLGTVERSGLEEARKQRLTDVEALSARLAEVANDPATVRAIRAYQLIELGESLITLGVRGCPLCDKDWDSEKLREYLAEKRTLALKSKEVLDGIKKDIQPILVQAATVHCSITALRNAAQLMMQQKDVDLLDGILVKLGSLKEDVQEGIASLHISEPLAATLTGFAMSAETSEIFKRIKELKPKDDNLKSVKRERWDILARIGKSHECFEKAKVSSDQAAGEAKLAELVYERYLTARSTVLGHLYASIRDRFVDLYRMIHGDDEGSFQASMDPTDAGIELQVNFYKRGNHHPCAMHSEGHQDSMGLCLFLALVERLNADCFPIIVLDDVMTSVDDTHRRELVRVLKSQFPKWQFVVTTHEDLWARQLQKYGLVTRKHHIEFYGWTIVGGPLHRELLDFREKAQKAIDEEKMNIAAWTIRYGLEAFYREACDGVGGSVTFQAAGDYDLGSLLSPSISKYKKLVNKGFEYANKASDSPKVESLQARKTDLDEAQKAYADDNWMLNPLVHYNEWATFKKEDLQHLLNAHVDLCSCLCCTECGEVLMVRREGPKEVAVQCPCRKTAWFLDAPEKR